MNRSTIAWMMPLVLKRLEAGLTQQEVADELGVTAATISHAETGSNRVSSATLSAYADLFDLEPVTIFVPRDAGFNIVLT